MEGARCRQPAFSWPPAEGSAYWDRLFGEDLRPFPAAFELTPGVFVGWPGLTLTLYTPSSHSGRSGR